MKNTESLTEPTANGSFRERLWGLFSARIRRRAATLMLPCSGLSQPVSWWSCSTVWKACGEVTAGRCVRRNGYLPFSSLSSTSCALPLFERPVQCQRQRDSPDLGIGFRAGKIELVELHGQVTSSRSVRIRAVKRALRPSGCPIKDQSVRPSRGDVGQVSPGHQIGGALDRVIKLGRTRQGEF
jgi:hypothetical protein